MSPRSAAILACRVIALVFGISAVTAIFSFLLISRELGGSGPFWAFVGPTLVISYVLWVFADRISEPMTRGTDETATAFHRLIDFQAVAFTIVGVVMVAEAIPDLIGAIASGFPDLEAGIIPSPLGGYPLLNRSAAILTEIIRIGIGVGLVVGSRRLAEWLALRNPEPQTEAPPGDAS